jgi:ligand-binding SRPBCC domain-containing protein
VLVSGSAVGYYGDRASEVLSEDAAPGNDFLAQLCRDWEAAAHPAEGLGLRVVMLRTGVVLGRDGGALAQMLPPFRLGAGGPVGSGRQYLPWIHLHDLVAIIAAALVDERVRGPVNGVAPEPVTSREFATALGRALHRPAILPTPAFALRVIFGEAATVLLGSQRVEPAALGRLGFSFAFPTLEGALANILGGPPVAVRPLQGPTDAYGSASGTRYLEKHRPTYELRTTTMVKAPLAETFAFFSEAENLGMLTPSAMRFSIKGRAPAVGEDATIEYRLRIGPVPITWRSRIVGWMPRAGFVDFQERGPYGSWWHEHSFRPVGSSTLMEDRVCYAPPFGLVGRIINRMFIVPTLRRIFQYRADAIRLRFGVA